LAQWLHQAVSLAAPSEKSSSADNCWQPAGKLVEGGQIKPLVERVFPFEELPQAHELLEQGRTRGKLVLTL